MCPIIFEHVFPVPAHLISRVQMKALVTTDNTNVAEEVMRFQARYVQSLNSQMALNSMGLPTGYWDSSIIVAASPATDEPPPDGAWVALQYDHGFPTVANTAIPFWERLPNEPITAFSAFSYYLAQERGRNLHDLAFEIAEKGGEATGLSGLTAYFDLYSWEMRAKAFDLFQAASVARYKAVKAVEIEDSHLSLATSLRIKASAYLEKNFDKLTGREVIEVLKLSVALERISTGLSPNGPGTGGPGGDPVQIVDIKTIIQNITANSVVLTGNPGADELMNKVLADPETAAIAQELAFKMQQGKSGMKAIEIRPADAKTDSDDVLDGNI